MKDVTKDQRQRDYMNSGEQDYRIGSVGRSNPLTKEKLELLKKLKKK